MQCQDADWFCLIGVFPESFDPLPRVLFGSCYQRRVECCVWTHDIRLKRGCFGPGFQRNSTETFSLKRFRISQYRRSPEGGFLTFRSYDEKLHCCWESTCSCSQSQVCTLKTRCSHLRVLIQTAQSTRPENSTMPVSHTPSQHQRSLLRKHTQHPSKQGFALAVSRKQKPTVLSAECHGSDPG